MGIFDAAPGGSAASSLINAGRSLLGKAPPDRNASKRLRKTFRQAKAGDPLALARLQQMAVNQGSKFKNINAKARKYYGMVSDFKGGNQGWVDHSGGNAQSVDWNSQATQSQTSPAPRAQRPCKYGPRVEGYCPPKPSSGSASQMPLSRGSRSTNKRPCKYGPRDEYGYCPSKSSTGMLSGRRNPISRRAESAAVSAGGKVAVKYAAPVLAFAAKAGLVLAAGAAAYWITSQLMRFRFKTIGDARDALADTYRHARQEYAAKYGRNMSPPELAELSAWFKSKDAELRAQGPNDRKIYNLTAIMRD